MFNILLLISGYQRCKNLFTKPLTLFPKFMLIKWAFRICSESVNLVSVVFALFSFRPLSNRIKMSYLAVCI